MKVQLETISEQSESPFRLLHSPRLNDLFFWHFHPEYELVYVEGANATRHVGRHISNYQGSDLVLIGSNIPHLNFDYGIKTDYIHEVLHIKTGAVKSVFDKYPELVSIKKLLQMAQYGIAFYGETKHRIGTIMKQWHGMDSFNYFSSVLGVLNQLSKSTEFELLHKSPFVNRFKLRDQNRLRTIHEFLEKRYDTKITLNEIARECNLGKEAFCRYFKKETGSTFVTFLNQYRISQAKRLLLSGHSVSEACFSSGFESLSYFNRTFRMIAKETPSGFKKRHRIKSI